MISATVRARRLAFVLPTSGAFDGRTRRMAATLSARGHDVTILARQDAGLPSSSVLAGGARVMRSRPGVPRLVRWIPMAGLRRVATVAWAALAARSTPAPIGRPEIVHAMGLLALPEAARLARASGAQLVYDARDLYAAARNIARMVAPARWLAATLERRWARRADAVVTVNDLLADRLAAAWRIRRPVVVRNCPPRWTPGHGSPDRLRVATGIAAGNPIALYHGGFSRERGLEQLAAAIREPGLEQVHAVFLGYGELEPDLRRLASQSPAGDRLHVLEAVAPEELLPWISTADVAVMAIQPTTLNHRLSTPNKLFEAIAAGVPVVASDFAGIRAVVDDPAGPLGLLVDPTDPAAIAHAIVTITAAPPAEREAWRRRCLAAAAARWNWERESEALLALYADLTGGPW